MVRCTVVGFASLHLVNLLELIDKTKIKGGTHDLAYGRSGRLSDQPWTVVVEEVDKFCYVRLK